MSQNQIKPSAGQRKSEWVRPGYRKLEAGAAESQRAATADGGGGAQGS